MLAARWRSGWYHRADDGLFLKALIPRATRVSDKSAPCKLQTAVCFTVAVKELLSSDVRRKAASFSFCFCCSACRVNGLNVVNSYVTGNFMTAIAQRDMTRFLAQALVYVGVFAGSTAVAVVYRFIEERLGLLWRAWLTKRATGVYLEGRTYLRG